MAEPIFYNPKFDPLPLEYAWGPSQEAQRNMAEWAAKIAFTQANIAIMNQAKARWQKEDRSGALEILSRNPNIGVKSKGKSYFGASAADFLGGKSWRQTEVAGKYQETGYVDLMGADPLGGGQGNTGRKHRAAVESDVTIADTSETFERVQDELVSAILDIANNQACSDAFKKYGLRIPYDSLLGSNFRIAPAATLFRPNATSVLGLTAPQISKGQSDFSSAIPYTEGGAAETWVNGNNVVMIFNPSQLRNPIYGGLKATVIHEFIHAGYKPGREPAGPPYGDLNYFKEGYEDIQNACK